MGNYLGRDIKSIQRSIITHVEYTIAMTRFNFSNFVTHRVNGLGMLLVDGLFTQR